MFGVHIETGSEIRKCESGAFRCPLRLIRRTEVLEAGYPQQKSKQESHEGLEGSDYEPKSKIDSGISRMSFFVIFLAFLFSK